MRIVIVLRQGVIQQIRTTHPDVDVEVVDLDAVDQEPIDSPIRDRAELLLMRDEDHPWELV